MKISLYDAVTSETADLHLQFLADKPLVAEYEYSAYIRNVVCLEVYLIFRARVHGVVVCVQLSEVTLR